MRWKVLSINVTFIVVDSLTSYDTILECSTLNCHWMVHSTYHQLMKFPTPHGIGLVRGDQPVARNYYVHSARRHVLKKNEALSNQIEEDPREERIFPKSVEGLWKVEALLPTEQVDALALLLIYFKELFA